MGDHFPLLVMKVELSLGIPLGIPTRSMLVSLIWKLERSWGR